MKLHVSTGQEWEICLNNFGSRVRIRIDSIDGPTAKATILPSGKPMGIQVRTLALGNRGARILRDANGEVAFQPSPPPPRVPRPPRDKTASDHLRRPLKGPRGIVRGGQLSAQQLEIERLSADGYGNTEIGRQLGITADSVSSHRTRIADVRAFEAMKRLG